MTNKKVNTKESTNKGKSIATIAGIEKPQERKNKINVSISDLARVSMFRQPEAAESLGVSISTLKRRFYDYNLGRWAADSAYKDNVEKNAPLEPIPEGTHAQKLGNIINKTSLENIKELDKLTFFALKIAFRQGLENEEESGLRLQ